MRGSAWPAMARLLFRVDAERAHGIAVRALAAGVVPAPRPVRLERLRTRALGFELASPLGLAAGFDKDGQVPDALLRLGFAFVEVGTITPHPQKGNPRPRMFRLPEDRAVINRLGFNSGGHRVALANLGARADRSGVVGVNLGANKESADRTADYVAGIQVLASVAAYFTVNVSSPNTPGLRDLQHGEALDELLAGVLEARDAAMAAGGRRVPLLLKIAPDLPDAALDHVAEVVLRRAVDGVVVGNTTLARPDLRSPRAGEVGGLSGAPLMRRGTIVLARMRDRLGPAVPLVGVGGILTGDDAFEKLRAGATLLQLYTGFIYRGPWTAAHVARELDARLAQEGFGSVREVTGTGTAGWAGRSLD